MCLTTLKQYAQRVPASPRRHHPCRTFIPNNGTAGRGLFLTYVAYWTGTEQNIELNYTHKSHGGAGGILSYMTDCGYANLGLPVVVS